MLTIYWPSSPLKPAGGPPGYLFNLKQELGSREDIVFVVGEEPSSSKRSFGKAVPKSISNFLLALKYSKLHQLYRRVDKESLKSDAIHFHSTEDLYLARNDLKNYRGKVLLTVHTPCATFREKIDSLPLFYQRLFSKGLSTLENIDEFAFNRCDYIIFPCKESEEPYFNSWSKYPEIRDVDKIRYVPSGVVPSVARESRTAIRKRYSIPDDGFVVSYVGRHNAIKGYDVLKEFASSFLKGSENAYFLIAGKLGPLEPLDHPHWIEAGWLNDPHSLIAASDVFVLPNHETYFDLVLLEVMSLGVPIVCSRTGGNKYILGDDSAGIKGFNDIDELSEQIAYIESASKAEIAECRDENIKLFEEKYSCQRFASRMLDTYSSLGVI